MKKNIITTILLGVFISTQSFGQGFCLTKPIQQTKKVVSSQRVASQPCKLYWIRIYFHRISHSENGFGYGYDSQIENTIINNL
jgi:hypothetical protein